MKTGYQRVSAAHGVDQGDGPGTVAQADVAIGAASCLEHYPATAIRHVLPHQMAALRHVHRLDQEECGDVLAFAVHIPGCQIDILDDRIVQVVRIELAEDTTGERFILPCGAEGCAAEGTFVSTMQIGRRSSTPAGADVADTIRQCAASAIVIFLTLIDIVVRIDVNKDREIHVAWDRGEW